MEYIGKVRLNLDFYDGRDLYSDGDFAEEELLKICKSGKVKEALCYSDKWSVLYHLSDIRGNIIDWYPFKKDAHILEIGSGCGAVSSFLCRKAERVVGVELSKRRSLINAYRNQECCNLEIIVGNFKEIELEEKFDYITLIGVLEYASHYIGGEFPYVEMLKKIKQYLKPDGRIIIAIENKMGLKYWNGAAEDHVGSRFKGIEDYRYIKDVRTFSKPELIKMIEKSGLKDYHFYYPVPDYKLPTAIYSDEYLPRVGEIRTWGTNYDAVRIGMFNEGIAADQICKDKVFDYFSNSFLVICNESHNAVKAVYFNNAQRIDDYQIQTMIMKNKADEKVTVQKSFLKSDKNFYIFTKMNECYGVLSEEFPNLEYVKPQINNKKISYEFIDGTPLEVVLAEDVHQYEDLVRKFRNMLDTYLMCNRDMLHDFTVTEEYICFFGNNVVKTKEKSLQVTNLDMQFSNLIQKDDKVYCIDYEWLVEFPVPFEFVLYRCISNFWEKFSMYFAAYVSREEFLSVLGVKTENIAVYDEMGTVFVNRVFGSGAEAYYLSRYKKQSGVIEWRSC